MPTTPTHAIPYPQGSDDATVPADMQALAERVDNRLSNVAPSQLAGVTAGQILVANGSGVVTGVAMIGDVTVSNSGVSTIGSLKVTTGMLANLAATTAKIDDLAVTTAKLGNGAVTPEKHAAPTSGTVADAGSYFGDVTARRFGDGLVILEGSKVRPGSYSPSVHTCATIPVGFRPAVNLSIAFVLINQSVAPPTAELTIGTNGTCTVQWFSSTIVGPTVRFDGIVFRGA